MNLCDLLGAPRVLFCSHCEHECDTWFDDYSVSVTANPAPGEWRLFYSCDECDGDSYFVFSVRLAHSRTVKS